MTHIWLAMGWAEIALSAYVMRRVWLNGRRAGMLEVRVREIRQ